MIVDNQNLFGSDPNKEPAPAHTENYKVHVMASSGIQSSTGGCGQELNPNRVDSCEMTLSGATVYVVPYAISAGKYNLTELMPLPLNTDVNGWPVVYDVSFSSDCDSAIQDFQIKTCTITDTAVE